MQDIQQIAFRDTTSGKAITLDCTHLLRSIKGRRTVYDGLLDGKPVIIKCFNSLLHGKRHFKKEIRGFKELTLRGIETAHIVAAGQSENGSYILVLEKIENTTDVFSLLASAGESTDTYSVLQAVFTRIARMHAGGVLQRDMHTGNFLWDGETIYVLDPAEITFSQHPLNQTTSSQQLAHLLASLPERFWVNKPELLETYFHARKWQPDSSMTAVIEMLTEKQRIRRIRRTLRKTLRSSKRYIRKKCGSYRGVFARKLLSGQRPADLIAAIDKQMEAGKILKRGNTCFVSRIQLNGHDVVVKRYNHKGFRHSLRHTLKGSRARKCWLFGHRLDELGIATAKPLGFLEERKCGLIWQSYILNEFVNGPNIRDYFERAEIPQSTKEEVSRKTETMLNNLVHFKMTHGDLKPSNILIHGDNPVLIDLDSMKRHHSRHLLAVYQQKMNDDISERNILWKK